MAAHLSKYARPELKERLVLLNGGWPGYSKWVTAAVASAPGGQQVSKEFVNGVLNGRRPAPLWMILVLTRIATEKPELSTLEADAQSVEWFETRTAAPAVEEGATHA